MRGFPPKSPAAALLCTLIGSPDTIELLKQRGHAVRLTPAIGEVVTIGIDGQWIEGAPDRRTKGY
jgi:gamma-glutamyltranspeptidase